MIGGKFSTANRKQMSQMKSWRHGSKNSVDLDIVYLFDHIPSQKECVEFVESKKDEDVNIIVVKNGIVIFSFRGSADETNNALLHTTKSFEQAWDLPTVAKIARIVPLKVIDTVTAICVVLRKIEMNRESMIEGLSSFDFDKRIKCLAQVDFEKCDLGKDEIKFIAFRLGQTLALMGGTELYTKDQIGTRYPGLSPLLNREQGNHCKILNSFLKDFLVELSGVVVLRKGFLHIFWAKEKSKIQNLYQLQSRGMVIDIKLAKVVYFPLTYGSLKCDWPCDDIKCDESKVLYIFKDGSSVYTVKEGEMFEKTKPRKMDDSYWYVYRDKETVLIKRDQITFKLVAAK